MSETAYAILSSVTLKRGAFSVFDRLSLDLRERRIALVGLNGSGKSSFLRLLNGLLVPDEGDVEVLGLDTRKAARQLPRHVGMVFQNPDHQMIFPTVREEIAFAPRQFGAGKAEADAIALACLAEHGCADWADRPVALLSEGQKQLVCLLAVTVSAPRLLLCDEPFAGLDLALRLHFGAFLARADASVLLVSHDLEMIEAFDRVIWFDGGKVRGDGAPGDVLPAYRDFARARAGSLTAPAL
jgi:biotin transport system ATP-binding protein